MSRGILIGDKHTFNDWGLILTSADIGYPMPKTEYIEIPHGDGSIDLTEALTGEVKYSNREGTFEFDLIADPNERVRIMNEIASYLHGSKFNIALPDEPEYVYISRLSIDSLKTSYMLNKLVIKSVTEPYKYKVNDTVHNITLDGTEKVINLENSRMSVIPIIETTGEITITFKDSEYILNAGKHQHTSIVLSEGNNELKITGVSGTEVTFTYREGLI